MKVIFLLVAAIFLCGYCPAQDISIHKQVEIRQMLVKTMRIKPTKQKSKFWNSVIKVLNLVKNILTLFLLIKKQIA